MGKDAANTLFAESQEQQTAPQQFKAQSGISDELNRSGLELRQPEGDKFHGDKFKPDTSAQYNSAPPLMQDAMAAGSTGGFHGDPLLDSRAFAGEPRAEHFARDSHLTNRMGDEFPASQFNAQGPFKTSETVILKPHSSSISSGMSSSNQVENFSSLATTNPDERGIHHHSSDLHHDTTHIHDGRHAGMLADGRTISGPALHERLQDDTMRDATIHDGRSRPLVPETADIPLAERIVAGVHAGDPLSRKGKLTSLFKKDKHNELDSEVLKNDHDLIPHEHLKKSDAHLADEHMSGPNAMLTRQQNNFEAREPLLDMHHKDKDAHLNKDVHILQPALQSALGPREHAVETFSATQSGLATSESHGFHSAHKESHLSRDLNQSHLSKDFDSSADATEHTSSKGGKLKDKLLRKKDQMKEKLHMKKDGLKKDEVAESHGHGHMEARANPKGHEIATIKIPGIESGDRAAQEMVNHQAKAKKELNAELKEHVGHSDHFAPSEILGHGMSQMSLHENRAVDTQLPLSDLGASDQITKDQVLAKSELNAEIKNRGSFAGQILPSEITGHQFQQQQQDRQFQQQDRQFQQQDRQFQQGQLPAFEGSQLAGADDALLKDNILAKQAVNAEIKGHAGTGFGLHHLEIQPTELSKDQFQREDLSQRHDQFHSKDFHKDDEMFQNKDFHKKDLHTKHDDFVPSAEKDEFEISDFQKRALHKNKAHQHAEIQPSTTQMIKEKAVNAAAVVKDTMGNMGSTISNMMPSTSSSAPLNDHAPPGVMDLKDDVHAEIKALGATHPDHIMPSDVSTIAVPPAATGLTSFIPEKVTHAAVALKDTLGSKISNMMPSSSAAPASAAAAPREAIGDFEKKDTVLAKEEVNAEIKALGATSDNLVPSDISTTHIASAPAAATGLASFIPEKVTHAAVALKDTLGSKISNMMPSSSAAPAPREAIGDFEKKDTVLAKEEVNAEIKALGATSDNLVPSDIPTHTIAPAAATGLASFIPERVTHAAVALKDTLPERVTHAAVALKDTLGSKISNMMPSSSAAPAVDLEEKDAILAKEEVNAEIKALGATSDNLVPSDISTTHTIASATAAPAAATGLASFIPEKVTHAAVALKDTLGSKISNMMPSSSAPASAPVDLEEKDAILAKEEVNAEIKALGATSDNLVPSDIPTHTIASATAAPAAATGLASFIPEKVTHAAVALKDTLGSKISNMLPSTSSTSHEVVLTDAMDQKDVVLAKNEVNAEIRELGSGIGSENILPSDVSSNASAAGTTMIHDGRLKSEMEYQQAHDDESHLSMRQMIQDKVTNAAMAVKETLHF